MKTYLTLEKSIPHKSNYDGSLYKSYVTSFFSYTQSHHTINDFYDEEGNVYIPEVYSFCEKKVDPDTHEEIVQLNCVFEQYEPVLGSLIERKNVYINVNGTVQIDDKIYHLSEPKICEFFYEIKINLGSEKTYQPLLCGGGSSRYILHLKSGKSIEYSGDYALCDGTPYGCKRYTKLIVDDLLKQVIDSF
jgi:hypothetical protein